MPTIKDLHCGMGEFLSASSEVENLMLALVTACQRNRSMDEVFVDFMDKTLGPQIAEFKRVCNAYEFTKGQRTILDEVYAELDTLLPKRNSIVHGTTHEIGKTRDSAQPYRIGITRGDPTTSISSLLMILTCHTLSQWKVLPGLQRNAWH
jgi:hypothetical protein